MTGPAELSSQLLGITPPGSAVIPWRVFVAETVTGRIVEDVPFVGNPQWTYGLNVAGSLQITVPVGPLEKSDLRSLLDYWRLSWGIAYGSHILQCGPVVTHQYDDVDGPPVIQVGAAGIWALFSSKRVLANPAWAETNLAEAAADTNLTGLSLHTIAKRLVQNDMTRNGNLPIVLPADIAGVQEREYPGYDLAYVGERLANLTQVIDGPEVEFRPRYTSPARTHVEWELRIGNPRLGNLGLPHSYDYMIGALTHLGEDGDGSQQQFRTWARGNGMERGLLLGHYADLSLVTAGWPMLEHVDGDHTSATETVTLDGWAQADVQTYMRPIRTWSARIRLDGTNGRGEVTGSPTIAELETGDTGLFNVRNHRWFDDGTYGQRILAIGSGGDQTTALLTLQGVQ